MTVGMDRLPDPQAAGTWSVAIVGLGPRGLSVLERLLIRLSTRPTLCPVIIWAIEPCQHGPGRVWRTDQPWWLTMNATAGEATVRSPDNSILAADTSAAAPSFADWTARDQGPNLQSADYPERRRYGQYLQTAFDELCASAPVGARVQPVLGA